MPIRTRVHGLATVLSVPQKVAEQRAILRLHPIAPEVVQHSVTPSLLAAANGRETTAQRGSFAQGDARLAQQSVTPGFRRRDETQLRVVKLQFRVLMGRFFSG